AHAETLAALRSGEFALPGLEIDTDLDWELLEGLVGLGAVGEPEIAAKLAADDTANGQQFAARVRAGVPTAEAKTATLERVLADASIPNLVLRSTGIGFGDVL